MTSRSLVLARLGSVFALALVAAACGSSGEDSGSDKSGGGASTEVSAGAFVDTNAANPTEVDPKSACATSSAAGQGIPASLVFMFDRSGSMKDDNKWVASTSAMKAFFADPATQGLSASLQFFPQWDGKDLACNESAYKTPAVAMRPLPDGAQFASVIDGEKADGDTPTLPALTGAIAYAHDLAAAGQKGAIVLVTDGEPNHCGSDVKTVSKVAAAAAKDVKTYVIGVGDALKNLNAIAAAGGTGSAILVSTTNPSQIADSFKAALGTIASQAMSCDYTIPAPPDGQSIDPNKVNVQYTPTGGSGATLTYSKDCTGEGWHYDDPAAPKQILLCPATCDVVMKDKGAKVNVFFGCAIKGGLPR
jgi:Mg-chelatase subunit ChlD